MNKDLAASVRARLIAIEPSEWMRLVWDLENGEDAPEFKDQAQAQRILGLLMRHQWQHPCPVP